MSVTRREALRSGLLGAGTLLAPRVGRAGSRTSPGPGSRRPQFVILSTSPSGDPLNANAPLTYDSPDLRHPPDPGMAPTELRLGDRTYVAARPWAELSRLPAVGDHLCFFHHATNGDSHGDTGPLTHAALLARHLAPLLRTTLTTPILLGGPLSARPELPSLLPTALRGSPLGSPDDGLAPTLAMIRDNGPMGQILAALVLIRRKLAPVLVIELPFGGDNHADTLLAAEARQTLASLAPRDGLGQPRTTGIPFLYAQLERLGLVDQVTLVCMNGFGRTLKRLGSAGRDHLSSHHVTVAIGPHLRPGVIGGIEARPELGDYSAAALDAATGAAARDGDVAVADSQAAVLRTVAAAVGLSTELLDVVLPRGPLIGAALV